MSDKIQRQTGCQPANITRIQYRSCSQKLRARCQPPLLSVRHAGTPEDRSQRRRRELRERARHVHPRRRHGGVQVCSTLHDERSVYLSWMAGGAACTKFGTLNCAACCQSESCIRGAASSACPTVAVSRVHAGLEMLIPLNATTQGHPGRHPGAAAAHQLDEGHDRAPAGCGRRGRGGGGHRGNTDRRVRRSRLRSQAQPCSLSGRMVPKRSSSVSVPASSSGQPPRA